MSYNLNDNVQENFEFILDGHKYKMRYPTVNETEEVQKAIKEAQATEDVQAILNQVYQFITPESKDAPNIKDLLPKQTIPVIRNFNEMIKTEFGGE